MRARSQAKWVSRAFEQSHSSVEVDLPDLDVVLRDRLSILINQANHAQSADHTCDGSACMQHEQRETENKRESGESGGSGGSAREREGA